MRPSQLYRPPTSSSPAVDRTRQQVKLAFAKMTIGTGQVEHDAQHLTLTIRIDDLVEQGVDGFG